MSNKDDTEKVLISMGFAPEHIAKAFSAYRRNYGATYLFNVELITEIAAGFQNKDVCRTHTHSTVTSPGTDKSHVSFTTSTTIDIDAGEDIPLKRQEDRAEHIVDVDSNETNESSNDTESTSATKYRLCSLILMLLIWIVLIMYLLTYFVASMAHLQWVIYIVPPVYILYLVDCFCVAQTPFYLRNIKTTDEVKEYVNKLIEAKPYISWEIEHFHTEHRTEGKENNEVNVVTSTEQRVINFDSWMDKSEYFDFNEFDQCMLMKLKIVMNKIEPEFMDEISSIYYKDAYDQTLKLAKRRDSKLEVTQNMDLIDVSPQD